MEVPLRCGIFTVKNGETPDLLDLTIILDNNFEMCIYYNAKLFGL